MRASRTGRPPRGRQGGCGAARWAARAGAAGATLLLSGCVQNGVGFLAPDGPVAALQRTHFWQVTLITLIVVLPVIVGVPWLAWHYRYGNTKARYTPHWDFSHTLEWLMWLVPAAIVVVLGTLLWIDTHKLDPYRPLASNEAPLRVDVVGLDWKWLFIYPDYHIASVGQMVFPQNRPVSLHLTTDTVMQSFMIPALGGQIYAMPGMVTKLNLAADHTGSFDGMNTQFNGMGFDHQHFVALARSQDGFNAWVRKVQAQGVQLNQAAYAQLARSSTPKQVHAEFAGASAPARVTWFNNVAPGFFDGIVKRYRNGTPVASAQQPGSVAYNARMAGE